MRKFASYGPPDKTIHYYAPRTELIDQVCAQLLGDFMRNRLRLLRKNNYAGLEGEIDP